MKQLVLFICTGNICRSPMAAALFNARAAQAGDSELYHATSAGTWALDDQGASDFAQALMPGRGLSLESHRARTVTGEMLEQASLILVMTRNQYDSLRAEFPIIRPRLHLLSEVVDQNYDIADPYGRGREEYEACLNELVRLIDAGYPRLTEWLRAQTPEDGTDAARLNLSAQSSSSNEDAAEAERQ